MNWNWQHNNWPNFKYQTADFQEYESQFLVNRGMLVGSIKYLDEDQRVLLKIELISNEAHKTSKIEGELLNRDSLQSSIRKEFGLQVKNHRATAAEYGIAEMMVSLYRNYDQALNKELLFKWHRMLCAGRKDLDTIGAFRKHEDPMQIVSGPIGRERVHYEAPPSRSVEKEMTNFLHWYNSSRDQMGRNNPVLRAGVAHLYFESIHPFEDGNGRIGRAISEKVLSEYIGEPTLIALSQIIEQDKNEYYKSLHEASISLDINPWLHYFSKLVLEAQAYSQKLVDLLMAKTTFYQKFDSRLNERQKKVIARMFKAEPRGFEGGLSADNYVSITGTSASTATRDLRQLVEIGALMQKGQLKGTRYYLNLDKVYYLANKSNYY